MLKLFLPVMLAMCLTTLSALGGVIFTSLVSFTGTNGLFPGAAPYGQLTLGPDGNFYGTTSAGGSNNLGTVYRLTPTGGFTSLISFNSNNGASPYAGLVKGVDGNLYGTTLAGGESNLGTIFSITTNGVFTNRFTFIGTDYAYQGIRPGTPMINSGDGSFYGTANFGGTTNAVYLGPSLQGYGYGTIYKFSPNDTPTVITVLGGTNGAHSSGGLMLGADGNFYGTTLWGGMGITNSFPGYGTVFKLTPEGIFTNIYQFSGSGDGGFIYAGLAQGDDGYLYGAAFQGGAQAVGTLFKISTNGSYVLLHTFDSINSSLPYAGLTKGDDGNFYGTASAYGYAIYGGHGSIFEITPGGDFTTLQVFSGADGSTPVGSLAQGADGNFYGTTLAGGSSNYGTIFKLSVPMSPVITALSRSNDMLSLAWTTVAGQSYQVQYSEDLSPTNWIPLTGFTTAAGGIMAATNFDSVISPRRYYRVVLQ